MMTDEQRGLDIEYDASRDVLTIGGCTYSGDLFRAFANAGPSFGGVFRFRKAPGTSCIELQSLYTVSACEDALRECEESL